MTKRYFPLEHRFKQRQSFRPPGLRYWKRGLFQFRTASCKSWRLLMILEHKETGRSRWTEFRRLCTVEIVETTTWKVIFKIAMLPIGTILYAEANDHFSFSKVGDRKILSLVKTCASLPDRWRWSSIRSVDPSLFILRFRINLVYGRATSGAMGIFKTLYVILCLNFISNRLFLGCILIVLHSILFASSVNPKLLRHFAFALRVLCSPITSCIMKGHRGNCKVVHSVSCFVPLWFTALYWKIQFLRDLLGL